MAQRDRQFRRLSIPHGSDGTMARSTKQSAHQLRHCLPLPVPPEPVKAIPDLIQAIVGPLIGKDAPKAREEPLDVVRHLVPAGKTVRQDHFRK